MEDLLITVPNVETLYLSNAVLSRGFLQPDPDGPRANTKFLPSLQSLHLEDITQGNGSWEPLVTYLTHQTYGNQIISLQGSGCSRMCPEVANEIKGLVEEFSYVEDLETESKGLWDRDRPDARMRMRMTDTTITRRAKDSYGVMISRNARVRRVMEITITRTIRMRIGGDVLVVRAICSMCKYAVNH